MVPHLSIILEMLTLHLGISLGNSYDNNGQPEMLKFKAKI